MKKLRQINIWDGRSKNTIVSAFNNILTQRFDKINPEQPFTKRQQFFSNTFFGKASCNFIHWPDEPFWLTNNVILNVILCLWILLNYRIRKLRGSKIIWLVHNLEPHNLTGGRKVVWNLYLRAFLKLVDIWIVMSPKNIEVAKLSFPALIEKPAAVILHPPYYNTGKYKRKGNPTIGHVGMIRKYKNLATFLKANQKLFNDSNYNIKIAGTFEKNELQKLSSLTKSLPRISLMNKHLTNEQYNDILNELDLMICVYETSFHSGVIIHSICSDVPVLANKNSFTEDLRDILGKQAIIYPDELSANLLQSITHSKSKNPLRNAYIKAYEKSEKSFLEDLDQILLEIGG